MIVENKFIVASTCFDDDQSVEWETKTTNMQDVITCLVLEIRKEKEKSVLIKKSNDMLLEAIDNHYQDSAEFASLYCDAKEIIEQSL